MIQRASVVLEESTSTQSHDRPVAYTSHLMKVTVGSQVPNDHTVAAQLSSRPDPTRPYATNKTVKKMASHATASACSLMLKSRDNLRKSRSHPKMLVPDIPLILLKSRSLHLDAICVGRSAHNLTLEKATREPAHLKIGVDG